MNSPPNRVNNEPQPAAATMATALAPLRLPAFRALWVAVLVSNIGTWMQTVGAQWFLVRQADAAILVALVQVVDTLPDVAFGWLGGVLADTFDRRRLLIGFNLFLTAVGVALTLLTALGEMPPALLLTFTLLLGTASAVALPAYQSLVNDIVPRSELALAATLRVLPVRPLQRARSAVGDVAASPRCAGGVRSRSLGFTQIRPHPEGHEANLSKGQHAVRW